MEPGFILGLSAITLAVIAVITYLGLKLSKYVQSHAPDSDFTVHINMSGTVLFSCLVAFWIFCMISRQNFPESAFGSFLRAPNGLAATIVTSIFITGVIAAVLGHLGYPIISDDVDDG